MSALQRLCKVSLVFGVVAILGIHANATIPDAITDNTESVNFVVKNKQGDDFHVLDFRIPEGVNHWSALMLVNGTALSDLTSWGRDLQTYNDRVSLYEDTIRLVITEADTHSSGIEDKLGLLGVVVDEPVLAEIAQVDTALGFVSDYFEILGDIWVIKDANLPFDAHSKLFAISDKVSSAAKPFAVLGACITAINLAEDIGELSAYSVFYMALDMEVARKKLEWFATYFQTFPDDALAEAITNLEAEFTNLEEPNFWKSLVTDYDNTLDDSITGGAALAASLYGLAGGNPTLAMLVGTIVHQVDSINALNHRFDNLRRGSMAATLYSDKLRTMVRDGDGNSDLLHFFQGRLQAVYYFYLSQSFSLWYADQVAIFESMYINMIWHVELEKASWGASGSSGSAEVLSIVHNGPWSIDVGDTPNISGRVTSGANAADAASVEAILSASGRSLGVDTCDSSGNYSISSGSFSSSGSFDVNIIATYDGVSKQQTSVLTVNNPVEGYDLALESVDCPTSRDPNSTFTVRAGVRNSGDYSAGGTLRATLYDSQGTKVDEDSVSVSILAPGNVSSTYSLSLGTGATEGQGAVIVSIETSPGDENGADNLANYGLYVGDRPDVDGYAAVNGFYSATDFPIEQTVGNYRFRLSGVNSSSGSLTVDWIKKNGSVIKGRFSMSEGDFDIYDDKQAVIHYENFYAVGSWVGLYMAAPPSGLSASPGNQSVLQGELAEFRLSANEDLNDANAIEAWGNGGVIAGVDSDSGDGDDRIYRVNTASLSPGTYEWFVLVDGDNNYYFQRLRLTVLAPHDLSVGSISVSSNSVAIGDSVGIDVPCSVVGGYKETAKIDLSITGPGGYALELPPEVISISGSDSIQFDWGTLGCAVGEYVLTAMGTIGSDANSANNTASTTVEVSGPTEYTITMAEPENGIVSPIGDQMAVVGQSAEFFVVPSSGYKVDYWLLDGEQVNASSTNLSIINVQSNHSVNVKLSLKEYVVSALSSAGGTISSNGNNSVEHGQSLSFTATAADHHILDAWYLDGKPLSVTNYAMTLSNITNDYVVKVQYKTDSPDWQSPTGKPYSMIIYATVKFNGLPIESAGSKLVVLYSDGTVAGVTDIITGPSGKLFQISVFSDSVSEIGLTLKVYDASSGETHDIGRKLDFVSDSELGSIISPVVYHIGLQQCELNLVEGYNWISVNVLPEDNSVGSVLAGFSAEDNDVIKSIQGSSTFYGGVWYPSDYQINPDYMYMLKAGSAGVGQVVVDGLLVDSSDPVSLVDGWNWVGYKPENASTVDTALQNLSAVDNDIVKSPAGSTTFYGGTWYPSDYEMTPGVGYMFKQASVQSFSYTGASEPAGSVAAASRFSKSASVADATPSWTPPVGKASSMIVYASVTSAGTPVEADGSMLAVFENGVVAGVASVIQGPLGKLYQMTVFSDETSVAGMALKVYDAGSGVIYDILETIDFVVDTEIGSIVSPDAFSTKPDLESFTFMVSSLHGTADPAVGSHSYVEGSETSCSVTSPDVQGTTRYLCDGWVMTGNDPLAGTANSFSMTITNDASLTWQWSTNYWLDTEVNGNGSVSVSDGWNAKDANVEIMATEGGVNVEFNGWSGDVPVANQQDNPLFLTMDQARAVTANFETLAPTRLPAPSPDPLAFGDVEKDASKALTFCISNTGNSVLTVTSLTTPDGFSGDWSGTVDAGGQSPEISVTFTPTLVQSYSGAITINCDNTAGDTSVAVSGTGTPVPTRIPAPSPDPLAFGSVQIGQNRSQTFRISNTGNSSLTVSSLSLPSGFSGSWSGTIAAGDQSPAISVVFAPGAEQAYSGNVTINCNNTAGDTSVAVSGTGAIGATRVPAPSPDPLVFGDVEKDSANTLTFTIGNTGNATLTVSSLSCPSGFSGTWSGTIAAGDQSPAISIVFAPTVEQAYSGNITINCDNTGGDALVAVSGTATNALEITADFSDGLPEGWQLFAGNYGSGDFSGGRMNGYSTDAQFRMFRDLSLSAAVSELVVTYRGNVASGSWGGSNHVRVDLSSGSYVDVSHGWGDNSGGTSGTNSAAQVRWGAGDAFENRLTPRVFESFEYTISFKDGEVSHRGLRADGSVDFDYTVEVPGFLLVDIASIDVGVYQTVLDVLWLDDLRITLEPSGSVDPESGLVSYWPLDGNLLDSTGSNDGTAAAGVTSLVDDGQVNQSPYFDGSSSAYITCGNDPSLDITGTAITVSAWVYNESPTSRSEIISKGRDYTSNYGYHLIWSGNGTVYASYRLSNGVNNAPRTPPLLGSTWYHIASTFDGTTGRIYVNGELAGETNVVGSIGHASTAFTIGAHSALPSGWGYQWQGKIDEVRVYNRVLTASEIADQHIDGSHGTLQFASETYNVSESGASQTVTVTRQGGSNGVASVNYATANGTATAGADYVSRSGTLNWASGDGTAKTFTVPILDDGIYEGDETFVATLSGVIGASMMGNTATTVAIEENDPIPTRLPVPTPDHLAFGDVENGSTSTHTFRISNTGNSTLTVSSLSLPAGYSGVWSGTISAGGQSPAISIVFSPSTGQAYGGNITINCDNTGGDTSVAVSGAGTVPYPSTPQDFSATYNQGVVYLAWSDVSGESSYELQRKTGSVGTYSALHNLSENVTSVTDGSISAGTTYYYRLRTSNTSGSSVWTTAQSVEIPAGGLNAAFSSKSYSNVALDSEAKYSDVWQIVQTGNASQSYTFSSGSSWIRIVPASGTLSSPGANHNIDVYIDTSKISNVAPNSQYSASVTLTSDDPAWSSGGYVRTITITTASGPASPLSGPSGTLDLGVRRPEFYWQAVDDALWYHVWVNRIGEGKYVSKWVQGPATTWTFDMDFRGGDYSWWISGWSPDGQEPWSTNIDFSIPTMQPETLGLIAPMAGVDVVVGSVDYQWQADDRATWYQLWSGVNGSAFTSSWYAASAVVSGAEAAAVVPAHRWGAYEWYVRGWGPDGMGAWSDVGTFSCGKPVPVSGSDTLLTWDDSQTAGAEWYNVWISNGCSWWFDRAATTDAGNGSRQIPLTPALPVGNYEWFIRAWSSVNGTGPWSDVQAFDVP